MRRSATVMAAVIVAACVNSAAPRGFLIRYQIGVFACNSPCTAPDTAIASARRGDTIWLQHDVRLLQALEPTARARIRPDCAENAAIQSATGATVRSVPAPTCPDSIALHDFVADSSVIRSIPWIIDSALTPAVYNVVGRVLVQPRVEPSFRFTVQ
jgi:hypothetical protein